MREYSPKSTLGNNLLWRILVSEIGSSCKVGVISEVKHTMISSA